MTENTYGYDPQTCPHDYVPCPFCSTTMPEKPEAMADDVEHKNVGQLRADLIQRVHDGIGSLPFVAFLSEYEQALVAAAEARGHEQAVRDLDGIVKQLDALEVPVKTERYGVGEINLTVAGRVAELLHERQAHIAERDRLKFRADSYACGRCGAVYGMDASLPDDKWAAITEGKWGILCLWCIDDLAIEKGVEAEAWLYYSGRAVSSRLYDSDGDPRWQQKVARAEAERDAALLLAGEALKSLSDLAVGAFSGMWGEGSGELEVAMGEDVEYLLSRPDAQAALAKWREQQ